MQQPKSAMAMTARRPLKGSGEGASPDIEKPPDRWVQANGLGLNRTYAVPDVSRLGVEQLACQNHLPHMV